MIKDVVLPREEKGLRKPFIAGNWKMNGVGEEAEVLARQIAAQISGLPAFSDGASPVDVAICPPFTSLVGVGRAVSGSGVKLGAQDMFWRDSGAYTGRVSGPMLKAVGCQHVILGHSECRGRFGKLESDITDETIRHFGDLDATVALKLHAALRHELSPILCVGETLGEREAGNTDQVVYIQVHAALHGLGAAQLNTVTIAYEPVWAIGTGQTCEAEEANRVCAVIRGALEQLAGGEVAGNIRIQYGGSVTADNAAELLAQPAIDGALVGGQSLKADAFAKIVNAAAQS
ncbi:MAG: triose-phosphate isomerase [Chloroflexi bacterium]|nr:triose-phosphate isomerase [Chloroflexota bacterium]